MASWSPYIQPKCRFSHLKWRLDLATYTLPLQQMTVP
jgi:hypothetical protein